MSAAGLTYVLVGERVTCVGAFQARKGRGHGAVATVLFPEMKGARRKRRSPSALLAATGAQNRDPFRRALFLIPSVR